MQRVYREVTLQARRIRKEKEGRREGIWECDTNLAIELEENTVVYMLDYVY